MKKTSTIYSFLALLALLVPSISSAQSTLQAKPLFPFFSSEKAVVTPAPVQPTQTAPVEVVEDTINLIELKNKPLPERRKIVATQLDTILLRLDGLYDKTKTATTRLGENDIDTKASQAELATAALSLAQARVTIDTLIASANDPLNETAITLMVGDLSFKDTVIRAETELRTSRESIINALVTLKASVSASITTPVN